MRSKQNPSQVLIYHGTPSALLFDLRSSTGAFASKQNHPEEFLRQNVPSWKEFRHVEVDKI